jgi:hypothetical protein
MSHDLIVVPRSLRMFQRESRSNKPASASGFRQLLEKREAVRAVRDHRLETLAMYPALGLQPLLIYSSKNTAERGQLDPPAGQGLGLQ